MRKCTRAEVSQLHTEVGFKCKDREASESTTNEILTLEQCQNLAKWGLDQKLKKGDCYWAKCLEGDWWQYGFNHTPIKCKYYKNPDLAELMEFARGLTDEWMLEPTDKADEWMVSYLPQDDRTQGDYWLNVPIQAVYKLIEKLMEAKSENNHRN